MCEEKEQLKLIYAYWDWEALGDLYQLNLRIDYEDWKKIKHCMRYLTYDSFEEEPDFFVNGWYCMKHNVKEVEEILNIAEENTVEAREKKAQAKKEERRIKEKEIDDLESTLREIFKEGVTDISGDVRVLEKDKNNKTYCDTFDIYGGGSKFIVEPDYIWYIVNNGADGDNWAYNNMTTEGAGAIGSRIDYDESVHELIEKYTELYKSIYTLDWKTRII